MKKIKYILSFLLFLIGFSFTGENFMFFLDTFENNFSSTTVYKPKSVSDDNMKKDITDAAKGSNIQVFSYNEKLTSAIKSDIYIYGNDDVKKEITTNFPISNKEYSSIFLGDTKIHFKSFDSINDMNELEKLYLIGEQSNLIHFKEQLIDKYGGNFPQIIIKSDEAKKNTIYIWIIIFTILILFTYYDIIYFKKEVLIKVVFGENLKLIILKKILQDIIAFTLAFFFMNRLTLKFTNSLFYLNSILSIFLLFIIINSVLYVTLLFSNYKIAFSNSKNERQLLYINYVVKAISLVLAIFILSSCIGAISEAQNYHKQKDFFVEHKNYNYVKLHFNPVENPEKNISLNDNSANIREKFYKEYVENSLQLVDISFSDSRLHEPTIMVNHKTIPYLLKKLPELKEKNFSNGIYYILPENLHDDSRLQQDLLDINTGFNTKKNSNHESLFYRANIEIIGIDGVNYFNKSQLLKNPIIILNNIDPDDSNLEVNHRRGYYAYDIMYDITDKQFNLFVQSNGLTGELTEKTNVFELYQFKSKFLQRAAIISLILLLFITILEAIVIAIILKLEYKINAVELSLKKILGYSIIERNKKILFITIFETFMSIFLSFLLNYFFSISEAKYIFCSGVLILLLELLFIYINAKKLDQSKITKILKGGAL